jgi:hypothetical protein
MKPKTKQEIIDKLNELSQGKTCDWTNAERRLKYPLYYKIKERILIKYLINRRKLNNLDNTFIYVFIKALLFMSIYFLMYYLLVFFLS